jgi:anthranilate 1,2-dioxygenase small subunit
MQFDTISQIELCREVQDLLARHIELIDDDRLEEWPDLFTRECVYKIIPRENADRGMPLATIFCDSRGMLVDRIVSLRRANIFPVHNYRHVLSPSRIAAVARDLVRVQTNYVVFQTRNSGDTQVYSAGKYQDEIVFDEGQLRFKSKIVVNDTNRVDTMMVRPI